MGLETVNKMEKMSKSKTNENDFSIRMGIVICDFHRQIAEKMLAKALQKSEALGVKIVDVVRVPGTLEAPLAAALLLNKKDIDCCVALGSVVQGDTAHDEVVAHVAVQKLTELSIRYNKPLGIGISGPRMSMQQAQNRAAGYAERAVIAAVRMHNELKRIGRKK